MTDMPQDCPVADEQVMLDRHRIVRVLVPRYDVDGYHYTKLADAVAQAKRSRPDV
jgi:hypothetical protein